jgi:hypothetical protein
MRPGIPVLEKNHPILVVYVSLLTGPFNAQRNSEQGSEFSSNFLVNPLLARPAKKKSNRNGP